MPEGYTHVRIALRAAERAGYTPQCSAAFAAGANGPDILFSYQIWLKKTARNPDLPTLGNIMHKNHTGKFLTELLQNARTPVQQDYALGFLTHYAADTTVHPYVYACMAQGAPYHFKSGHGYLEIGLDSWLHQQDFGTAAVSAEHASPRLVGSARAESMELLRTAIAAVYGWDVPLLGLSDSLTLTRLVRQITPSRTPLHLRRILFRLAEPLLGGKGFITGHCSPAVLRGTGENDKVKLPRPWRDPFSGRLYDEDIPALLERAERTAAACIEAGQSFLQGKITCGELSVLLGSRNYLTGVDYAADTVGEGGIL